MSFFFNFVGVCWPFEIILSGQLKVILGSMVSH